MNKYIILLACVVSLTAAGVVDHGLLGRRQDTNVNVQDTDRILRMSRDELLRQKFILDVLLNVHQSLVNDELLRLADTVVVDQDMVRIKIDDEMLHVIDLIRNNRLLGKDDVFTITNDDHLRQMIGIYRLLVSVRDWDVFQRIVAHIRKEGNGVLLVNTLLLAVRDREDTQMLIMPGIHEILPELYHDEDVIRKVQNLDLTHLMTATDTVRPGLMDVINMNKHNTLMNRGIGGVGILGGDMNLLTRSNLWMPWRQMRMQLASQKMGGIGSMNVDRTNMMDGLKNLVVIPLNNQQVGMTTDDTLRTMLIDDMGLRSFVHDLVNDLILNGANINDITMNNEHVGHVDMQRNVGVGIHNGRIVDTMDMHRMGVMKHNQMMDMDEMNIKGMNRLDNMHRMDDMDHLNRMDINRLGHTGTMGMKNGIHLDDTLPTTNINSDRLLHVNRRRLHGNTDMHMNVGGRIGGMTEMHNDRNRFLNVMHGGQVHDGRRVIGVRGMDMDIQDNRMNMNQDWHDDMLMRHNMVDRTDSMINRNIDNDDMLLRRGGMGVDMHINRGMMMINNKHMNLDMNKNADDLPTISVNSDRLLHVNRRRLHQKIATENNLNGNIGQMDQMMPDRMHDIHRGGMIGMNDRNRFMHTVHVDHVMDGRHVVNRHIDDVDVHRSSIRGDHDVWGQKEGRWNKNMDVNQDDTVQNTWIHRMNLGRGMENIGDKQQVNENTWQHDHMWHDNDELNMIKGSMHRRMPRSLDHMEMGVGMGMDMGMNTKRILMQHLRGGEVLLHNLQQLVARINLETIALGISDLHSDNVDTMNVNTMNSRVNNMRLIDNMDQRFALRMNDMRMNNRRDRVLIDNLNTIETTLVEVLRQHIGELDVQHGGVDARDISVINGIIGEILMGRVDHRMNLLNILRNILLQTETVRGLPTMSDVGVVMHNPIIRRTIRHVLKVIDRTMQELLGAHEHDDLELVGVKINNVVVDKLRTMVDVTDHDLTNLLNNELVQKMKVQKSVVGRQQRLNHKNFNIKIDLTSDRNQQVVVRTLLVPTLDVTGRRMTVDQQRMNAIVLDAHLVDLVNGPNLIQRKSIDIDWTTRDTTTLTDIYRRVMLTLDGQMDAMHIDGGMIVGHNCRFPHRLLLPRGHVNGLPMQLLVIVTRIEDVDRHIQQLTGISTGIMERRHLLCGLGVSSQNLDRHSMRFPLDRHIDNIDQLQQLSNVHLMDVMIMHEDKHL